MADDCVLLNNIDASATKTWNEGDSDVYAGFAPVGTFTGSFDGGDFTISHLYINRPTATYVGLFGLVSGTAKEIKDVNLTHVDITGRDYVGSLAGYLQKTTITNIHTSGTVESVGKSGTQCVVGGLIGAVEYTTAISSCSASVEVEHTTDIINWHYMGGFLGITINASYTVTISDCTASGNVTATCDAGAKGILGGGFIGDTNADTDVDGCYASGNVTVNVTTTGYNALGGFVGGASTSATITMDKCFAYGDISSLSVAPAYVGGFFGYCTTNIASKCGAEGNVESNSTSATINFCGGFAGNLQQTTTDCYALGNVCSDGVGHTDANIGGFAGYSNTNTFDNCYSSGAVLAGQTNGGGFIGVDAGSTETNCFWDSETSNYPTTSAGDETPKTTVLMKTAATFTDAGWDLTDVWEIATYTRAPGTGVTVWLSEVGDYENFEEGVNDADSFQVTLTSTNNILWIEALESLIAGTGGDEWKIGTNDFNTPITPTDFTARQQTNYGSKNVQALKVNEQILFVDFVGRKVRELTYSDTAQKFVAPDLSALAEHITSSGITCIAQQKNPDSILWVVLGDGSLISMTYEREQNVVAWSDHPMGTDVLVQSVCVIPGTSEDEVWLSVKRTMAGVNSGTFVIYIERMASRTFAAIANCFFIDSGLTTTAPAASITLAHLIGETVAILGDGVVMDTATVGAGGTTAVKLATVATNATVVQAGLPYTYKLEPMRPDVSGPGGSTHGSIIKVPEMGISFLNTMDAKYGVSDSVLYDIDWTNVRWTNNTEITGLFTGDVVVVVDGGFTMENNLIISGSDPMPCTVRALIPRMEVTGR